MDLVFVVDISASMSTENENIADNFDGFIGVLDDHIAAPNGFSSYRIGVTSSSVNGSFGGCSTTMGLDGSLFNGDVFFNDCPSYPARWIDGPAAGVATDFACYAENPITPGGGTDCGKEMPLRAIEMFGEKLGAGQDNAGFYSVLDESLLVFVIMTDESEDAYSSTNAAATKSYLDNLAGGEGRYGVIVLAGPGPSGCDGDYGSADYAAELETFAGSVANGYFNTICEQNLYLSLKEGLENMVAVCETLPQPQ